MGLSDLISLLDYFGITPEKITPLVILGGVLLLVMFKHTKPMRDSLHGIGGQLIALEGRFASLESKTSTFFQSLQDIRERFAALEGKTSNLFNRNSPTQLTEEGNRALKATGLKTYIDTHAALLIAECALDAKETSYDVQEASTRCMMRHQFPADLENEIKRYAFDYGITFDALRIIGGLYLRDKALAIFDAQS